MNAERSRRAGVVVTAFGHEKLHHRALMFDFAILMATVLALWLKQLLFSVSIRSQWAAPDESLLQWAQGHPAVLALSLSSAILAAAALTVVPRSRRLPAALLLNAGVTTLVIADLIHARFFGSAVSVLGIANAGTLGFVLPSIIDSLRPMYALLYVDLVLGIVAVRMHRRATDSVRRAKQVPVAAALVVVGAALVLPFRGVVAQSVRDARRSGLEAGIASTLGLAPYHLYDIIRAFQAGTLSKQTDLNRIRALLTRVEDGRAEVGPLFGVARGRNLILVNAESIQTFPIGLEVNGQPVTPRLSSFIRESLFFPNLHDQTNHGATSDGEFLALNSLHPPGDGYITTDYNANTYDSLPSILTGHGYATLSAVASASDVWNMNVMHTRYGFAQALYADSFTRGEYINGSWSSDREFFAQLVPRLELVPRPFMAFLLTSSSHNPFRIPEKYKQLRLGSLDDTLLGRYLQAVSYFDAAFGTFVDNLKEKGLLDESVIAVYGDHRGVLPDEIPELSGIMHREPNELFRFQTLRRVPLIIRLPHGQGAQTFETMGGQIDIAPTLLSLLGLGAREDVMLGRNLATPGEYLMALRDGSFADGQYYYLTRPDPSYPPVCYNANTGSVVSCAPLEARRPEAREQIEVSDLIMKGDLIPEIKGVKDSPGAPARVNTLGNAGFETLIDGRPAPWILSGATRIDGSAGAPGGKIALHSGGARDVAYQKVPVASGQQYVLECFVRAMRQGEQAAVQLNWQDKAGKLLDEQVEVINALSRWERYRRTLTAPAGADHVVIYASALDPGPVWFDDFFFGEER